MLLSQLHECSKEAQFRVMDRMKLRIYAPGERTEQLCLYIVQRGRAMHRGAIMKRHDAWGEDIIMQDSCVSWSRSSDLGVVAPMLPTLPAPPEVGGSRACSAGRWCAAQKRRRSSTSR